MLALGYMFAVGDQPDGFLVTSFAYHFQFVAFQLNYFPRYGRAKPINPNLGV